jgi:membrane protease subunit (stomatin/prohibitin family)
MGIFDKLKNQFIEVIEWIDESRDAMVYRFPVAGNEIKMGAQLIVRESQNAIFFRDGKALDLFTPGRHSLTTQNMPLLTKLESWKYGFNSPFKAEVYFVTVKDFLDLKWGTPSPILLRDADFGMLRLRAFGSYSLRIEDPRLFLSSVVGTNGYYETEEINTFLKKIIVTQFTDALGEAKIPALELASHYSDLSRLTQKAIAGEFKPYGLSCVNFYIQSISLPPEVEKMVDKKSQMGILSDSDINKYTRMEAANALSQMAEHPGSGAMDAGIGLSAGMAMGKLMGDAMGATQAPVGRPPEKVLLCQHCGKDHPVNAKFCPHCGQVAQSVLKICSKCQAEVPGSAKFCPSCGAALVVPENCSKCGAKLAANAKFCGECGHKMP